MHTTKGYLAHDAAEQMKAIGDSYVDRTRKAEVTEEESCTLTVRMSRKDHYLILSLGPEDNMMSVGSTTKGTAPRTW